MNNQERQHREELAKTRSKILWSKVYENKDKDSRIWHLKYRKFAYHKYEKQKTVVSVFENKQSICIDSKNLEKNEVKKIIFSFKRNRLSIYAVNPLRNRIKPTKSGLKGVCALKFNIYKIIFSPIKFNNNQELTKKIGDRFKKLLIKKCKANKVPLPYNYQNDTLENFLIRIKFPALSQILENSNDLQKFNASSLLFYKDKLRLPLKKAVKRIVGFNSKSVTREFISAIKEDRISGINISHLFKGKIKIDNVLDILKKNVFEFKYWQPNKQELKNTKVSIETFSKIHNNDYNYIFNLIQKNNSSYYITDSIRILQAIKEHEPDFIPEKKKSFNDYHDYLTKYYNKIKTADRDIKHNQLAHDLKLSGQKILGYEIVLPKRTHELLEWGETMHNCIGGYSYSIESGYSLIFGAKLNNKIEYGIELDPKELTIRQFRGKYNENAPNELMQELKEKIKQKKIDLFNGKDIELKNEKNEEFAIIA